MTANLDRWRQIELRAAHLLEEQAQVLKDSNADARGNWSDDPLDAGLEDEYNELMSVAGSLRRLCGTHHIAEAVAEATPDPEKYFRKEDVRTLLELAKAEAVAEERERTAKALEFAEYLAKAAELFRKAVGENGVAASVFEDSKTDENEAYLDATSDALTDAWGGLDSAIYEFRKRAIHQAEPEKKI